MITEKVVRSKNTEVDTVLQLFITAYRQKDWSLDPHLTGIFDKLIIVSEKLSSAINRLKTESQLEELDHDRDEKVRAFFGYITGNTYNPNAVIKSSALALMVVLDNFGLDIVNESYPVESSLVRTLCEQLSTAEMEEHIGEIPGAEVVLAEVTDSEAAFYTAYFAFEQEKTEEKVKESATEIKKDAVKLINESLLVYLSALAMVNESEYGELARTINQIIEDHNRRVRERRTAKK